MVSTEHLVPADLRELYHVREWRNAAGVLFTACPGEWSDIIDILRGFRLLRSEILTAGGGFANFAADQRSLRSAWVEREEVFDPDQSR
jgi:hypothetical protein